MVSIAYLWLFSIEPFAGPHVVLTSTQFPSMYQLTGLAQVTGAVAHCRHISYSRHTPRWKTARKPPACGGIGKACKSTHVMTVLGALTGVNWYEHRTGKRVL
jgi:hypothetical protein